MVGTAKLQVRRPGGQGVAGRELMVIYGNSSAAVGPIETMVPGLPGQGVNGNIR